MSPSPPDPQTCRGRDAVVTRTVRPGSSSGRVRVGERIWRALASIEIEAGRPARVVAHTGRTLIVAPPPDP